MRFVSLSIFRRNKITPILSLCFPQSKNFSKLLSKFTLKNRNKFVSEQGKKFVQFQPRKKSLESLSKKETKLA